MYSTSCGAERVNIYKKKKKKKYMGIKLPFYLLAIILQKHVTNIYDSRIGESYVSDTNTVPTVSYLEYILII